MRSSKLLICSAVGGAADVATYVTPPVDVGYITTPGAPAAAVAVKAPPAVEAGPLAVVVAIVGRWVVGVVAYPPIPGIAAPAAYAGPIGGALGVEETLLLLLLEEAAMPAPLARYPPEALPEADCSLDGPDAACAAVTAAAGAANSCKGARHNGQ